MRVLFSTGSPARYMAPPRLADEQVNCGPDWQDRIIAGYTLSLETPIGEYDLAAVAKKLPPEQQPDVVVCLVDASWRNQPRNLKSFRCPKVLLVADTHHLRSPLTGMISYAKSEPFDKIILLYDRHHADLLRDAGLNPYWLPGLTFPHDDAVVHAARSATREHHWTFSGQLGPHHPRRQRLLGTLFRAGVPLQIIEGSQREGLQAYGRSLGVFNASLNGDLNLRTFEALAAGALLLTDRLAAGAGLEQLWRSDEVVTYRDSADLVERARYFLQHADAARAVAQAGQAWFDTHFCEAVRRRRFAELVLEDKVAPEFEIPSDSARVRVSLPELTRALPGYERLQRLHQITDQLKVAVLPGAPPWIGSWCDTLPRMEAVVNPTSADVLILPEHGDARQTPTGLPRQALWLLESQTLPSSWLSKLKAARFGSVAACPGWYARAVPAQNARALQAWVQLEEGKYPEAMELAQAALRENPASVDATLLLADLALEGGNRELAQRMVATAKRLAPDDPRAYLLHQRLDQPHPRRRPKRLLRLAWAHWQNREHANALTTAFKALGNDAKLAEAFLLGGLCRVALGQLAEALLLFELAGKYDPQDPLPWLEFGLSAREANRPSESLGALLHAHVLDPLHPEVGLALAEAAMNAHRPELVETALAAVPENHPLAQHARRLRAGNLSAGTRTQSDRPRDLIVCYGEVNRLHGTGVLVQRFFPEQQEQLLTLRSATVYGGQVELGGEHLVFRGTGLTQDKHEQALRQLLAPYRIRRILCIPFRAEDYANALSAHRITGAPLCTYVMDDQTVCANEVPHEIARRTLEQSRLRLVISPEMQTAYEDCFGLTFSVVPPLVTSAAERVCNHWRPSDGPRCALVGNVWSPDQFTWLRAWVAKTGVQLDWYGNEKVAWLPATPAVLATEGIRCRGFVPEGKLATAIASYAFVVVPTGLLDGSEKNEWLTRLSLPSRMVFILTQTFTPMLVLGSRRSCAARFVERLGVGCVSSYTAEDASHVIAQLVDPVFHEQLVDRAKAASETFVRPNFGNSIWRTLEEGEPLPDSWVHSLRESFTEPATTYLR